MVQVGLVMSLELGDSSGFFDMWQEGNPFQEAILQEIRSTMGISGRGQVFLYYRKALPAAWILTNNSLRVPGNQRLDLAVRPKATEDQVSMPPPERWPEATMSHRDSQEEIVRPSTLPLFGPSLRGRSEDLLIPDDDEATDGDVFLGSTP